MRDRVSVHLMGIGGVGVSGLARVALHRGMRVSGCDRSDGATQVALRGEGALVDVGHSPDHIALHRPDLVIYTAAIPDNHPELEVARSAGIEVVTRAEYLGRLMSEYRGPAVSVAGSHGKSSVTAMVTAALSAAGVDPTCLIGADYGPIGGNVRLGKSQVFVTESCEAYGSFWSLHPDVVVITSAEPDHLDFYHAAEGVLAGYARFASGIRPNGCLIWCADDDGAAEVSRRIEVQRPDVRQVPYSLGGDLRDGWVGVLADPVGGRITFDVSRARGGHLAPGAPRITLTVPGEYNVRNALAAVAVCSECGADLAPVAAALGAFAGVARRFEQVGNCGGVEIWDDYAHHPSEVRALLAGARGRFGSSRLVVVFQPHLYSRTRDFMTQFADALTGADVVIVDRIYAAREPDSMGVHGSDLVAAIGSIDPNLTVLYADSDAEALEYLRGMCRPGDVLLTVGAGDVRAIGERFAAGP